MIGLCALSPWGLRTGERLAQDSLGRSTQARLAETIAFWLAGAVGATSAFGQNADRMIIGKKATGEIADKIMASGKKRLAAVKSLKVSPTDPQSAQQAAELSDLAMANAAAKDHIAAPLRTGRFAEEAAQFQEQMVAENETTSKHTPSTVWNLLAAGCLTGITAEMFGGMALTRNIAMNQSGGGA